VPVRAGVAEWLARRCNHAAVATRGAISANRTWRRPLPLPSLTKGYRFYLIVFYVLVATLFISTGICIWVGWCFKNDSFPFLWPIKVARIVVSLFVSMFYIASLNIFLIAMQCKPEYDEKSKRHWVHLIYHHGEWRSEGHQQRWCGRAHRRFECQQLRPQLIQPPRGG
jgi:hypothetical protein